MSGKSKVTFYRAKPEWTRAFFAPLALQHNLTQQEFEEFNVFKLAEFVFREEDGAPFPEVDGPEYDKIEYHDIEISNSALAVQFARSDHRGGRKLSTASAHPLQFRQRFSFDYLNPIPAAIREQFFGAVDQIWDYLVSDFRELTRAGSLDLRTNKFADRPV
jgi:hypothetical protein